VQHLGSGLHAILVTGAPPNDGASFQRAVRAVEEAGGEVQNAHSSVVGARAIYTIHTLVNRRCHSLYLVLHILIGNSSHILPDFLWKLTNMHALYCSYVGLFHCAMISLQVAGQGGIARVVQRLRAALRGDA
jgi:hypothetical protein